MAISVWVYVGLLVSAGEVAKPLYFDCRSIEDARVVVLHYKTYESMGYVMVGRAETPYHLADHVSFDRDEIKFRDDSAVYKINRASLTMTRTGRRGVTKLACLPAEPWPRQPLPQPSIP